MEPQELDLALGKGISWGFSRGIKEIY